MRAASVSITLESIIQYAFEIANRDSKIPPQKNETIQIDCYFLPLFR